MKTELIVITKIIIKDSVIEFFSPLLLSIIYKIVDTFLYVVMIFQCLVFLFSLVSFGIGISYFNLFSVFITIIILIVIYNLGSWLLSPELFFNNN